MRTVVVTGSASGLGAAIQRTLEGGGHRVVGIDLAGTDVSADLSTAEGREVAWAAVRERTPEGIDGLVACAGLGPTVPDRRLIVGVDYFGAVATLDGLVDHLAAGDAPAAVAIASNSAGLIPPDPELHAACLAGDEATARERAATLDGPTVYGTSKHALAVAVRRRAADWGPRGVRLNAVCPGPVETPLLQATLDDEELGPTVDLLPIPLGRHGHPDEIASLVRFLLSRESSLVQGALLWADGGTDAAVRPDHV